MKKFESVSDYTGTCYFNITLPNRTVTWIANCQIVELKVKGHVEVRYLVASLVPEIFVFSVLWLHIIKMSI